MDLCTGSGIQALMCASHAKGTVAVDIQERAVELATLNVYLNRLENRVKIQKGNLYDAIGGNRFDFICANPPLLPSANRLKSPLVAAGGEDGLDLTRQILYGLPNHLVPGGTCQMLGTSLGDERGPFLEQELNQLSTFLNCSFIAIFTIAYPLSWMLNPLAGNSSIFCGENFKKARLAYQKLFERFNASHIFPFYLTAVHEKGRKPEVSILPQYRTTWDGFWTVNG